ncbi:MAG: hypothetical protein SFU25_01335 [Candidatus Caenarcaniphilales bacterium]|nr:hypothetical protein [Candidatus Caenarcaniphilales bacterium]
MQLRINSLPKQKRYIITPLKNLNFAVFQFEGNQKYILNTKIGKRFLIKTDCRMIAPKGFTWLHPETAKRFLDYSPNELFREVAKTALAAKTPILVKDFIQDFLWKEGSKGETRNLGEKAQIAKSKGFIRITSTMNLSLALPLDNSRFENN